MIEFTFFAGLCTLLFTLSVFIWKSTCVYNEGEKETVPCFVLYFILEFVKEEHHVDSGPMFVSVLATNRF